jgi:hypothetical protein
VEFRGVVVLGKTTSEMKGYVRGLVIIAPEDSCNA